MNASFTKAKPSENVKTGRRITTTLVSTNINQKSLNPSKDSLVRTDAKKNIVEHVANVSISESQKNTKDRKGTETVLDDELDNLDGKGEIHF